MKKTLLLNPPSYEGFDGGAGSRYQARREVRSFWYPIWLARPAALLPGSRLIDAPARGVSLADVLPQTDDYDLVVIHTSTPSFASDVKTAEAIKARRPQVEIGFVGPHVTVQPEPSLAASPAIDFVARDEADFTIKEVAEGRPYDQIQGISYRRDGQVVHNAPRPLVEDLDALPHAVDVYRRDLVIEDYYNGYMLHPYVALHGSRGCRSRCTFCLWPQTMGGRRYRVRSPQSVAEEFAKARDYFPQVREIFFDDDTFTDDRTRAMEISRRIGPMGKVWSCNAKANVPYDVLKVMRENGLRLLLVGYESGSQRILNNIKKGITLASARRFTADCRKLGIAIHGTFILGLPGETKETIEETIRYAQEINPDTIQVSLAAAYPGTELYRQAVEHGWLRTDGTSLVSDRGVQVSSLEYPDLPRELVFESVGSFYHRFYMRPGKLLELSWQTARKPELWRRRLREGREFFQFLARRKDATCAS